MAASQGPLAQGARQSAGATLMSKSNRTAPKPSSVLWPIDAIRDVARVGLANVSTDSGGVPRYIPIDLSNSRRRHPIFRARGGVRRAAGPAGLGSRPGISMTAWLTDLPPAARDRLDFRIGLHFGPGHPVPARVAEPSADHRNRGHSQRREPASGSGEAGTLPRCRLRGSFRSRQRNVAGGQRQR
jgi:hypothetical protein